MKNITIMLQTKAIKGVHNFSIEAGRSDGKYHFDHHGIHSKNPCPANDKRIQVVPNDSVIEITHIDADCFIGLIRMLGKPLPKVDLDLVEKIDLNGSSVCDNVFDPTLVYMVGIGEVSRQLHFPRVAKEPIDVTEIVEKMLSYPERIFIDAGKMAQTQVEQAYQKCLVDKTGITGFWSIGSHDQFDPSRPYKDGIEIVIVFRSHYQSISIYCNPKSVYEFVGRTINGIKFEGHPKACGSPRGVDFYQEDARMVFEAIK
jgi:hypothetical protein